jgi:hypothetical protein
LGEGIDPIAFNLPTWFFCVLIAIPGAAAGYHKFTNYCCEQLNERMKVDKVEYPDKIAMLLEHHRKNPAPERAVKMPMLQADSRLITVAESDTTSCHVGAPLLPSSPRQSLAQRLREEVKPSTENDGSTHAADLSDAKLLNGIINEILHLYPPVPSRVFRKIPPEGFRVKDTFVPSDTAMARGEICDLSASIPTADQNSVRRGYLYCLHVLYPRALVFPS